MRYGAVWCAALPGWVPPWQKNEKFTYDRTLFSSLVPPNARTALLLLLLLD